MHRENDGLNTMANSDDNKHPIGDDVCPGPGSSAQTFNRFEWPFYWLTQASGRYMATLERALRDIDLDVPTWRALMLLDGERARSVSYLANEAITKLSTMTRIVQRMVESGLVTTRPSAKDARVTEVVLTANGNRARILAWQAADTIFKRTFDGVDGAELDALGQNLAMLCRLLDQRNPQ